MGVKFLLLASLISVLIISGCSQTGSIINRSTNPVASQEPDTGRVVTSEKAIIDRPNHTETGTFPLSAENQNKPNTSSDACETITCPGSVTTCDDGFKSRCKNSCKAGICSFCVPDCSGHGACDNMTCEDSEVTCPDGYVAKCKNTCKKGKCSECVPDCTGHESNQDECEISCGLCKEKNDDACTCDLIIPCDGNNICEDGEYSGSSDCPDCDDGNRCTEDLFNFSSNSNSTDSCFHNTIIPCCGNGICDNQTINPENHTTCPGDCEYSEPKKEPENETNLNISITNIEPFEEWVEIFNLGNQTVGLTNWTLSDAANHIYSFQEFTIKSRQIVTIHTGHGTDNSTDLFWNRGSHIWNNNGDNAILRNAEGDIVSAYDY